MLCNKYTSDLAKNLEWFHINPKNLQDQKNDNQEISQHTQSYIYKIASFVCL